jgi:hypothetical protein
VLIVLLEDHLRQDRPGGNLRRPAHFSVTWNRLVGVKAACGLPEAPAFMRYFKTHGRYLGFIVYSSPHHACTNKGQDVERPEQPSRTRLRLKISL